MKPRAFEDAGRWWVYRAEFVCPVQWVAWGPVGGDHDGEPEYFGTHAEAIAYADRKAREADA